MASVIHFKFRTDASAPAEIFDPSMVDPAAFDPGPFDPAACTADWWSGAEGELLVLDHLEPAPARPMPPDAGAAARVQANRALLDRRFYTAFKPPRRVFKKRKARPANATLAT